MSHPLSEQMEVRPNESVSQVSAFAINENEEDEEDIYSESFNVPSGNSSEFRSRNSKAYPTVTHLARCLPLLAGHFKMTPETLKIRLGICFMKLLNAATEFHTQFACSVIQHINILDVGRADQLIV